ncbi:hypothetical protein G3I44_10970 [Halogeometricum borinquense]|uniref:Uncharacterized protein n=1 Tax=Halogeometricum borinquense TaxID=60847 RepID=A0A6C0UHS0_9EURY|nr:hypothetical protein [Halogeometricum borinquense]QIB74760.1 hypothetical protein G3I44_10970 [Halogeometricum borinquense]
MFESVPVTIAGGLVWIFDKYEQLKKRTAHAIADRVWSVLNKLGEWNRKGLIYKRFSRRVREYHKNQTMENGHVSMSGGGRVYNTTSIDDAFQNAFRRRFFGYLKVVLGVVFIALIDFYSNSAINLTVYGLVFDGIGAFLIGRSVFQARWGMKQKAGISSRHVSGSQKGEKLDPMDMIVEAHNSVDAAWGASLFVIGVVIQIVSIVNFTVPFWFPL